MAHLIDLMPKAGMIYQSRWHVTRKTRHDSHVCISLLQAGIGTKSKTAAEKSKAREAVDDVIASSIAIATTPDIINMLEDDEEEGLGLFRFCDALKPHLNWAEGLPGAAFYDFIFFVIEARREWKINPRYPFDPEEQCAIARAADAFLEAAGRRWDSARADFELFCVCGGMEEDEEEGGEDEEEGKEEEEEEEEEERSTINMDPLGEVLDHEMQTDEIVSEMDKMDLD
ncbi:hypothetical protein F5X96DRAFT_684766 [Biscogniauxia mediterranea]|nr:hypothetical protein F5X96DRAFT_684766 [Biscogniauxia mediterranea]